MSSAEASSPLRRLAALGGLALASCGAEVMPPNRPPAAAAVPLQHAFEGAPFELRFTVTDPDGDTLRYEGGLLPAGATLDMALGLLQWTPGYEQAGTHPYYVLVHDDGSPAHSVRIDFSIQVAETNRPPEIEPFGPIAARSGTTVSILIRATDPDGDAVSFRGLTLPRGATLDGRQGRLEWLPGPAQGGEHPVEVAALDEADPPGRAVASGVIIVDPGNLPPVCVPAGIQTTREGEEVQVDIRAEDADGDALTFAPVPGTLPEGASISPEGLFGWLPGFDDAGEWRVDALVQDDGEPPARVTCGLDLVVRDVNRPPVVTYPLRTAGAVNVPISVFPQSSDPDGNGVRYAGALLPGGAAINAVTGEISWTPARADGGAPAVAHRFQVRAEDDGTPPAEVLAEGVIEVLRPNEPPEVTPILDRRVTVGDQVAVQVEARDPDGDALSYEARRLPAGAVLGQETGLLAWEPLEVQEGPHEVRIEVLDDGEPKLGSEVGFEILVVAAEPNGEDRCDEVCQALMDCGCEGLIDPGEPRCAGVCDEMDQACILETVANGETCEQMGCVGVLEACEGGDRARVVCDDDVPSGPFGALVNDGGGDGGELGEYSIATMGLPIDRVLGDLEPIRGGQSSPWIRVLPETGPLQQPISFRLCVGDPDGLGNIDLDRIAFNVNGTDLTPYLYWNRTGLNEACAEAGQECGWGAGRRATHTLRGQIRDLDGNAADDEAVLEPSSLDMPVFDEVGDLSGLGGDSFTTNSHTGGVAWIDYDGDTWPDLFVTGGLGSENRLYRNNQQGGFDDVTPDAMRMEDQAVAGVNFADIDNDGDDDLYIYSDHPEIIIADDVPNPVPGDQNHLFRNDGDGVWTDITEAAGLLDERVPGEPFRTISAAFVDADLDGCIDLYTVHWRHGLPPNPDWDPDRLYRGDCQGGFVDATEESGLDDLNRKGFSAIFADLTMDGAPDLYLVNVYSRPSEFLQPQADYNYGSAPSRDLLFVNRGDGSFDEVSGAAGVGQDAGAGMGIDVADFDRDGDFDIYITDLGEPIGYGNVYYRSLLADEGGPGDLRFADDSFAKGARPMTASFGWGCSAGDFNNDGNPDLFTIGNGDRWLFVGNGAGDFVAAGSPDPTAGTGVGHEDHTRLPSQMGGYGTAKADYDHDGDLDLVAWKEGGGTWLLQNISPNDNHWVRVRLVAATANGSSIGALIVARGAGGWSQHQQILGGSSQQSRSEGVAHFGLGDLDALDRIEVHWPGGEVQILDAPEVDRVHTIEQE